ncbi:MAG: formimidoylglutamate deiminase [Myxococcales bacterium]|nr:formimidoylglutamate deiminase [Myxococcales bacterium]
MSVCFVPDFAVIEGRLVEQPSVFVDDAGKVSSGSAGGPTRRLAGRLLLPGFVNGHSHAFQRVLRGRTELRAEGNEADDFWSWRERMYQAATALKPEQLYAVSKQAFVEMALAGVTTVGEFHYLQHQADGTPYDDESLLAKTVIQAARDVGLRIVLLRVGYARAGFQVAENPRQRRFIDGDVESFLRRVEGLRSSVTDPLVTVGVAPHSVRAVPRSWLEAIAKSVTQGPVHMHVSEQPAELRACLAETGRRPIELLSDVGLLGPRFTGVHAIHLEAKEVELLGQSKSLVCACPSTERNLGDGIVRADELLKAGVEVSLGSDSQAHIDLLEEARQLEGHLRLLRLGRAVLFPGVVEGPRESALGEVLLRALTAAGARSLGVDTGALRAGQLADFVTIDLNHPSMVGVPREALVSAAMLGASSAAIRDVCVQGRLIVEDGRHPEAERTADGFRAVMSALA